MLTRGKSLTPSSFFFITKKKHLLLPGGHYDPSSLPLCIFCFTSSLKRHVAIFKFNIQYFLACENWNTVPFKKLTGVCIQAVVHLPLQGCFIFSLVKYKPLTYNKVYEYPDWAVGIGWTLALTSMICIPMVVVIKIIRSDGPLIEVGRFAVCYLAVTSESSVYPPYSCKCSTTQNIRITFAARVGLINGSEDTINLHNAQRKDPRHTEAEYFCSRKSANVPKFHILCGFVSF